MMTKLEEGRFEALVCGNIVNMWRRRSASVK